MSLNFAQKDDGGSEGCDIFIWRSTDKEKGGTL